MITLPGDEHWGATIATFVGVAVTVAVTVGVLVKAGGVFVAAGCAVGVAVGGAAVAKLTVGVTGTFGWTATTLIPNAGLIDLARPTWIFKLKITGMVTVCAPVAPGMRNVKETGTCWVMAAVNG